MFGAITLIAILVALLARTNQVSHGVGDVKAEMLERKIALAQSDLEAARRVREQLTPVSNDQGAALLAEKRLLTAAVEKARADREKASKELASQVAGQNVDVSAEMKNLVSERAALERRIANVSNTLNTQAQVIARLETRISDLSQQISEEQRKKIVTVRLPKERAQTKKPFSVICKYGKVYPLRETSAGVNKRSIVWERTGKSEISKPIESLGLRPDLDAEAIAASIRLVSSAEFYIVYSVYPDSVEVFRVIREKAIAAGYEVGFDMIPANENMLWGEGGTSPPPL